MLRPPSGDAPEIIKVTEKVEEIQSHAMVVMIRKGVTSTTLLKLSNRSRLYDNIKRVALHMRQLPFLP